MNKSIAKYLFYYPVQFLRGQRYWKYMHELKSNQYKTADELKYMRIDKLRELITYSCANVPYYKNKLGNICTTLQNSEDLCDLSTLPILSKRDVLEHENELVNPKFTGKLYTRKTGGSTGMTLHFKKDARALAINDAIMFRCYQWYGIDAGDKQVRFWGVPVTTKLRWKEKFKDWVLNRIRISAFDISETSCMAQYEMIRKFKPDYFYGYTTAIYGFCLFMKKAGVDLNDLGLKAVICTAEKMYPHHIALFRETFKCPVVDEYGSSETGIIAFQCKQGNMHLMSDHLYVEFLDENNKQVEPGALGRIVVTDLASYAMPLIRYDIGDLGSPSDKKCSCGIGLPLMDIVEGRKEDFIRIADGKFVHAAYLCYTLKEDTVHEFKMYQKDIGKLLVQLVKSPSYSSTTENKLERNLRTALGDDVEIDFEYLEKIPREVSGKLRYFVSEID
jgi:phenylacetate-CoA ligase